MRPCLKKWSPIGLLVVALVLVAGNPLPAGAGTPLGSPFLIGDVSDQTVPAVAPAVAYNSIWQEYLAVWYNDRPGNDDIYGQLVTAQGDLKGGRRAIVAGQGADRRFPDVAYSPNFNEYLVVWEHYDTNTTRWSIRGQRVADNGDNEGSPFVINDPAALATHTRPRVAHAFTGGVYLVVWERHVQGALSSDIVGRIVWNNGYLPGSQFLIAQGDNSSSHGAPALAYDRRMNEFLVTWERYDKAFSTDQIAARIVRPNETMEAPLLVANYSAASTAPSVGAIPTYGTQGQYLVAWEIQYTPTDKHIMARLVGGDGVPDPVTFYVAVESDDEIQPTVAGNERSRTFLVSWIQSMGWSNVHAREVRVDGGFVGPGAVLAGKYAQNPAVSQGPSGGFLVAYDDRPSTNPRAVWGYLWGNRVYLPLTLRNP
jgi:hypothetical protein